MTLSERIEAQFTAINALRAQLERADTTSEILSAFERYNSALRHAYTDSETAYRQSVAAIALRQAREQAARRAAGETTTWIAQSPAYRLVLRERR